MPDISDDKSIFAKFIFPTQLVPHRSVLLTGVKIDKRILNNHDREVTRRGGNFHSSNGGGGANGYGEGFHQQRRDLGGGPGIAHNFANQNSHSYGRGGHSSQYSYHRTPQNSPHNNRPYSASGPSIQHSGSHHMGGRGGRGGVFDNYPDHGNSGQSPAYRGVYASRGSHHHHSSAPPYQSSHENSGYGGYGGSATSTHPPTTRGAIGYSAPYMPAYGASGYGGTGVGLPARPASFGGPGNSNARGGANSYRSPAMAPVAGTGYRPPAIAPAVTRTGHHPYSQAPPQNGYGGRGRGGRGGR